jgi:anaerobic dimethyl sulfoxide reductase subunit B (iron-sulfur subunit)
MYKERKYGAVLFASEKCDGLRKCWEACPYGSILFASDDPNEKASKCTMCIDRLEQGKKPICVVSCSMRAMEFGPIDELREKFGNLMDLEDFPPSGVTTPAAVFKPREGKQRLVPWNASKALHLWKKRSVDPGSNLPDFFEGIDDVIHIPPGTVGRDRLVIKPRNVEELMYYTTDND